MARQPFLPVYTGSSYSIGAGVINERPEFVAAIGRCVAFWSFIEHQMAILLGVILKADNEASIAVFTKLRRGSNQREAIEAAARATLDEPTQKLLGAILKVVRSNEKERNDLVHGHWGILADRTDLALWVENDHHSAWNTKVLNSEDRKVHVGHEELRQRLFVYPLSDIEDAYMRMNETWAILFDFIGYVRGSKTVGYYGAKGAQLYERLSRIPRIQEALGNPGRRQNTP
jgi:hypothetical protein